MKKWYIIVATLVASQVYGAAVSLTDRLLAQARQGQKITFNETNYRDIKHLDWSKISGNHVSEDAVTNQTLEKYDPVLLQMLVNDRNVYLLEIENESELDLQLDEEKIPLEIENNPVCRPQLDEEKIPLPKGRNNQRVKRPIPSPRKRPVLNPQPTKKAVEVPPLSPVQRAVLQQHAVRRVAQPTQTLGAQSRQAESHCPLCGIVCDEHEAQLISRYKRCSKMALDVAFLTASLVVARVSFHYLVDAMLEEYARYQS